MNNETIKTQAIDGTTVINETNASKETNIINVTNNINGTDMINVTCDTHKALAETSY